MNYTKSIGIILIGFGVLIAADQNTQAIAQKQAVASRQSDMRARMGKVISIDKSAGIFVLQNKKGLQDTFAISDSTKITLKGNKKFADITPGMGVFAVYQKKDGKYNVLRIEDMPDMTSAVSRNLKKNDSTIKKPNAAASSSVPKMPVFLKKGVSVQNGTFVSLNSASKYIIINKQNVQDTIVYTDSTIMKTPSKKPAITDLKVGADLMICYNTINGRKTALQIWERFLRLKPASGNVADSSKK